MALALAVALPWPVRARLAVGPACCGRCRPPPAAGDVDHLVVARARRGDHRAFAQIVDHYDHRLRGLAFRLLGDRDRMDDVLQEAYVKAFRSLPRFKGESALGHVALPHRLQRLHRRPAGRGRGRCRSTTAATDRAADPGPTRPTSPSSRGDLAAALDTLPPDQRAAVLLVDAYGLDYDEAADVLGVAAGTIGSRLSRARAALRTVLREDGR